MNSIELVLQGASRVLFAGMIFGAGLPVVYALALRVLTMGATTYAEADGTIHSRARLSSRLMAGLLITVVVAGIALGLVIIVASGFGNAVSFENVFPSIVEE